MDNILGGTYDMKYRYVIVVFIVLTYANRHISASDVLVSFRI